MVCHWLIDSNSSALSSQHPQTLRFFPREAKNIKTIDVFLKASRGQILTKTIRTREQLAELTASRLAQQVALVCGGLKKSLCNRSYYCCCALNKCINFALCIRVCSNFDSCAILNSQAPKIFCL